MKADMLLNKETKPNQNTNRRKIKFRGYKEIDVWREEYITISRESRLKNSQGWNGKNKLIINTYVNEQHHGIKQTNLCRSEINQRKNRSYSKEHYQTFKTWVRNQCGKTDKKASTTNQNAKTEEKRENMLGRNEQSNMTKTNDTSRGDKLKDSSKRTKIKKIPR